LDPGSKSKNAAWNDRGWQVINSSESTVASRRASNYLPVRVEDFQEGRQTGSLRLAPVTAMKLFMRELQGLACSDELTGKFTSSSRAKANPESGSSNFLLSFIGIGQCYCSMVMRLQMHCQGYLPRFQSRSQ